MPTVPGAAVATGVSTGTVFSDRIVVFRAPEIAQKDPIKRPLLTMLSFLGLEDVPGPKFDWLEEDRMAITTSVKGAQTLAGTVAGTTDDIKVNDAYVFKAGSIGYLITPVHSSGTGPFRFIVNSVADNETINITLLEAAAADALKDKDEIVVIGTAYQEFSDKPLPQAVQPTNEFNYIQLFRDTWAASDYMQATQVYGQSEFERLANRAVLKQMADIEHAIIYGIRHVDSVVAASNYSSASTPTWKTGGLTYFITSNVPTTAVGSLTYETYSASVAPAMYYNPGGRWLGVSGVEAHNAINKMKFLEGLGTNVEVSTTRSVMDEMFGMSLSRLVTPHGTVNLVPHYEVLRRRTTTTLGDNAKDQRGHLHLLLDMDQLRGCTLAGNGLAQIEQHIENPGQSGRQDGAKSYFGLKTGEEAHHVEYQLGS